jgi:flagellar basal-body rod protein FlgG
MIDVIANNLANVNTTGFKRSRVSFEDVMYETVQGARITDSRGQQSVGPVQVGKGVRVGAVLRLHAQGAPEQTGRLLDVAIEGDGFFQVMRPDGTTAYTRDGSFTLSEDGTLVTNDGYAVLPEITMPQDATSVQIGPNGIVSVTAAGSTSNVEVGRIELARFLNPNGLLAIGENQYTETSASGQPIVGSPQDDGFGRLMQGALESSNVEIVQEMTDMIAAQRAYEINAKAIQAGEEMMQATHDLIR